jgi:hypothetical protein
MNPPRPAAAKPAPPDAGVRRSAWEEAADHGIDMSLVEAALRKTPAERVRAMEGAAELVRELQHAADGTQRAVRPVAATRR